MIKPISSEELIHKIQRQSVFVEHLYNEVSKVIVGQSIMLERLLIALLCDGHILLEGVPGLAKTLAIRSLSEVLDTGFSRIQFTPDMLPGDITGTMIYNMGNNSFEPKKGPIFSNLILADEINRAPAKVQSALLECMQERQTTIGDKTYLLPEPFLVMATQNPVEQEGTYPLPEAQMDRFMMKVVLDYPEFEDERYILKKNIVQEKEKIRPVISFEQIKEARTLINQIKIDKKIEDYILTIVFATRYPEKYGLHKIKPYFRFGASPRGSINLARAVRAKAFLSQRGYVTPDDVESLAIDILQHRIGLSYEAEADEISAHNLIKSVLESIETL